MGAAAILVVDDDPAQRALTVRALQECCDPAYIATAEGGPEALDYLLGRGAHEGRDVRRQPRLVLLDIRMPRMNGVDVLKTVRADPLTHSVPVVMLSSSTDRAELDSCYEAGANSVVRKGVDYDETCRKMRQVYDFWLTVNEANRASRV